MSIETCYQNTGVALTVALSSFHGETQHRAAGVPVFYMACQVRFSCSPFSRDGRPVGDSAKRMERPSDGSEDYGAEEASCCGPSESLVSSVFPMNL